jgi:hypothetical protein
MAKTTLRLAPQDIEPSRAEIYKARIEQSHREWHGPNGEPWKPYDGSTEPWTHKVKRAGESQYRIVVESEVGWFRKFLKLCRLIA